MDYLSYHILNDILQFVITGECWEASYMLRYSTSARRRWLYTCGYREYHTFYDNLQNPNTHQQLYTRTDQGNQLNQQLNTLSQSYITATLTATTTIPRRPCRCKHTASRRPRLPPRRPSVCSRGSHRAAVLPDKTQHIQRPSHRRRVLAATATRILE